MNRPMTLAALAGLLASAPAGAQVLPSDVAVIEDTDGAIYAASSNPMADGFLQKAACAFYQEHPDADPEVLFVVSSVPMSTGFIPCVQSGIAVNRQTRGIGIGAVDSRAKYCAVGRRLRHAVRMCGFDSLPDDPRERLKDRQDIDMPALAMMAHEMGHHWMAYVSYDRGDGSGQQCNLRVYTGPSEGTSSDTRCGGLPVADFGLHWSALFDSGALMFGNHVEDLGNGTFRFYGDGTFRFGHLDQYLMGLRLQEQVGPLLLVRTDSSAIQPADLPLMQGVANEKVIEGWREEVSIDDIVRFEGQRVPLADACHWRGTMVLVHPKGKPPAADRAQVLAGYGNAYQAFYAQATDERGSIDLTIDARGPGTATCPNPGWVPPDDAGGTGDVPATTDVPATSELPESPDAPVTPADGTGPDGNATTDPAGQRDAAIDADGTGEGPDGSFCLPGAIRCQPLGGGVAQVCGPTGRTWDDVEDCARAGKACRDGACTGGSGGGCSAPGTPATDPGPLAAAIGLLLALLLRAKPRGTGTAGRS